MNIRAGLDTLIERRDLSFDDSHALFQAAMGGELTPAQLGALLMGLRVKGETANELAGAAAAMRERSLKVSVDVPHLVDTCGTGGSGGAKLFNISTAAAFVAAAAGAHVAKHGNRAMTSTSGSADVLEAAGVNLALPPEAIARCIEQAGVGFLFAQAHHSAMRHAAPVRRELAVRTLFNVLGPLTNPASAPCQVIGVFSPDWQQRMAEVLAQLGTQRALIVHSSGLDELSIAAPSRVVELNGGRITDYELAPEDVKLKRQPLTGLAAGSVAESLALVEQSLTQADSAAGAIVALNAGAALYAAGRTGDLSAGVDAAREAIGSGAARARLTQLVELSQSLAPDQ